MLKIIAAIMLMAGLAQARPARFDDWWFAIQTEVSSWLIDHYTTTNLTGNTDFGNLTITNAGVLAVDWNGYTMSFNSLNKANVSGIVPSIHLNYVDAGYYSANWAKINGSNIERYTTYNTQVNPNNWLAGDNVRPNGQVIEVAQNTKIINSMIVNHATPFDFRYQKWQITSGMLMFEQYANLYPIYDSTHFCSFSFPNRTGYVLHKGAYLASSNGSIFDGSHGIVFRNIAAADAFFMVDGIGSGYPTGCSMSQSGPVWLESGGIVMSSNHTNAWGMSDCTWYLHGGYMWLFGNTSVDYNRPIVVTKSLAPSADIINGGNIATAFTATMRSLTCATTNVNIYSSMNVAATGTQTLKFRNGCILSNDCTITHTINNFTNAVVEFAGPVSGAYSLTLAGISSGVTNASFLLSGSNSYANTYVNAGTLSVQNNNALPSSYNLYVTNSAVANLGSITNTINKLFLGGTEQNTGTHGSSSSTATYTNDIYFTGAGVLSVTNGL